MKSSQAQTAGLTADLNFKMICSELLLVQICSFPYKCFRTVVELKTLADWFVSVIDENFGQLKNTPINWAADFFFFASQLFVIQLFAFTKLTHVKFSYLQRGSPLSVTPKKINKMPLLNRCLVPHAPTSLKQRNNSPFLQICCFQFSTHTDIMQI